MASIVLIAGGIAIIALLNLEDMETQWEAEANISHMQEICRGIDSATRTSSLKQARAYNARLAGESIRTSVQPYDKQLALPREPTMSFIEIPRIAVRMPVYHGVEENVLMAGIGHWPESSLPVGGRSTHCVLMGHSGMRNTRMLDDLHVLEPGDRISVCTLGIPLSYEVCGTETVEPNEVAARTAIVRGKDMLTLVTCTPYGVNSHRLLVHANRCETDDAHEVGTAVPIIANSRNAMLVGALCLLLAAALAGAIARIRQSKPDRASGTPRGVDHA